MSSHNLRLVFKCIYILILVSGINSCDGPFTSQVDRSRLIFKGKDFDAFETKSSLTLAEAKELLNAYLKENGAKPLPIGGCVIVDGQYFFTIESSNKLGKLSLNGYYVDPATRSVVLKMPNLTYYPE